jgi:hypothetical protein
LLRAGIGFTLRRELVSPHLPFTHLTCSESLCYRLDQPSHSFLGVGRGTHLNIVRTVFELIIHSNLSVKNIHGVIRLCFCVVS